MKPSASYHQGLTLVHRIHDSHVRKAGMPNFPIDQGLRHHADYVAIHRERGIRNGAHQADVPAAINPFDAPFGDQPA